MQNTDGRNYYAIRTYFIKDSAQLALVESYIENYALPALNRMGIEAVGAFLEMDRAEKQSLRVLIPYPSLDMIQAAGDIFGNQASLTAGRGYLDAPKEAPAYERFQCSLFSAFVGMPQIRVPAKKDRIFELRRYESHSEVKAKKKIEMFNTAEIDIFLECGLTPVFFGEAIVGERMPNLTYMLVFDDLEHQTRTWQSFLYSPEWKGLSGREEYKDTVSEITQTMLVPTSYSQV